MEARGAILSDARDLTREERRQRMPIVSAFIDELAAEFGAVVMLHAEEGGLTWGAPQTDGRAVPLTEMECYAIHKQGKAEGSGSRVEGGQSRAGARVQAPVLPPKKGRTGRHAVVSNMAYRSAK